MFCSLAFLHRRSWLRLPCQQPCLVSSMIITASSSPGLAGTLILHFVPDFHDSAASVDLKPLLRYEARIISPVLHVFRCSVRRDASTLTASCHPAYGDTAPLFPLSHTGALAQVFGRKPVLLGSILLFMLGSGLCGGARHLNMLIGGRSVSSFTNSSVVVRHLTSFAVWALFSTAIQGT